MEKLTLNFFEDSIAQTTDFNAIEDKIETLTNSIREINIEDFSHQYTVFSTSETYDIGDIVLYNGNFYKCTKSVTTPGEWTGVERTIRRNIQIDDDLSGKTLYFNFPSEITISTRYSIITSNQSKQIDFVKDSIRVSRVVLTDNEVTTLATYNSFNLDTTTAYSQIQLSNGFGIVTSVNSEDENLIYQAITSDFVTGNWEEYEAPIIPLYNKETWQKGMVLYNARLNNIETGIKNIGKYYFRPYGWQNDKFWTENMSFSYRDMNRWVNNINLIIDRLNNESGTLFPSDTLYPSETLLPH